MEMTEKIKERFCKNYGFPIKIFREPIFTSRLKLYDSHFGTLEKWDQFVSEVSKFGSEKSYMDAYGDLKERVISDIKGTEGYREFNECDMNWFPVKKCNISSGSLFNHSNINSGFISFDLVKGCYTALKYFDSSIVGNSETYEEFISRYTDVQHFIESKYIRQVIFGNCNPRRQTTIEKHMMSFVLEEVLKVLRLEDIRIFTCDEVITYNKLEDTVISKIVSKMKQEHGFDVRVERFIVGYLPDVDGYLKIFPGTPHRREFKCVNSLFMPILLRYWYGEGVREEDLMFLHDGLLSKLVEYPKRFSEGGIDRIDRMV